MCSFTFCGCRRAQSIFLAPSHFLQQLDIPVASALFLWNREMSFIVLQRGHRFALLMIGLVRRIGPSLGLMCMFVGMFGSSPRTPIISHLHAPMRSTSRHESR